jgi:hypothetical protein
MLTGLMTIIVTAMPPAFAESAAIIPARVTCKQVSSCEEAVEIWCNGYRRADGDNDGIPCENVCHTNEQVDEIRARRGC